MTARRFALAIATLLVAVLAGPSPAAASIPCSKGAIEKIVRLQGFESITTIRCADLTGDGRGDVAYTKSGGGSGGDVQWGIVYERYKPSDPNCCPSPGTRTESATWNGRRFVKRLVAVRRP